MHEEITPMWEAKRGIGAKKLNEVVMRVQSTNPQTFTRRGAFDGKKNLFAPQKYFAQQTFVVPLDENPDTRRKKHEVQVVMTHVKEIDYSILQRYLQTERPNNQVQNEVNLMLNMLNVFVQATPKQKEGIMSTAKSIFVKSERRQPPLIAPLELWRGYFQSVRPAFDKLIINVDVTIGVILPKAGLEKVCADLLRLRNQGDLRRLRPDQTLKLRQFLKGVKVQVNLKGHKSAKSIKDLISDVGAYTFDRGGDTVTVAQHFKEVHNSVIPPSALGVKFSKGDVIPISFCDTVEQFYRNRASPEVVRAALEFTPADPARRAAEISKAFGHFDYSNSHVLGSAGISVHERPELIRGRMLPSPSILFGGEGRDKERRLNQRAGVWDVMRQKLAQPASISSWLVVDFANVDPSLLRYFVEELIGAMRNLGMQVMQPPVIERRSIQTNVLQELANLGRQIKPALILAVLPDPAETQYRKIKRFGDIIQGVVTQCVRWSGNLSKNVSNRKVNQYQNNLILKINPKMGGVNFTAKSRSLDVLSQEPFMVIGADVSHPGPGSQLPSVASVVGSYDRGACQYAASTRVQSPRVEMIEEFASMFKNFLQKNRVRDAPLFPRRIVVFRDGVSEGEFENVGPHECHAMEAGVIKSLYPGDKKPQIVYLVVGKRHHVRFFPRGPSSADSRGNGNFPAGLVVDSDIVHPRYIDFYLQSQPGLKGTSIPSHYTILRNDPGFPLAMLKLTIPWYSYSLCHNYSRSTRSVKIPAPVYCMQLVCRRAKFHYDEDINDYSVSSVSGDDDMNAHLDYYRRHFSPVNGLLRDFMYFV
ncbi:Piwi-domain-containing protein [Macrolepiota fuliginosa MF-IS2]|uniref:Piwi-domain-containing protein n=1 Tax=Macrolepiota fuliginosa MF-IS2 TaxID=1400762 RepID=A0A9P5XLW4_9AGAR|nr:Piwi-domain-containing protein [Macrolepiota fuliginosa MF-IS2]